MAGQAYIGFAGRKLVGLIFCVLGMVGTAIGSLGLCSAGMLDGAFATNITLSVVGGISTLYATFVGGNYGEHYAHQRYGGGAGKDRSSLETGMSTEREETDGAV